MEEVTLAIDGIFCGRCVATVVVTLGGIAGVNVRSVTMDSAVVDATPSAVEEAVRALALEGFGSRRVADRASLGPPCAGRTAI